MVIVTPALFVLAKELTVVSSVNDVEIPEVVPLATLSPTLDAPPHVTTLSFASDAV